MKWMSGKEPKLPKTRWLSTHIHENLIKDLLAVHYYAVGVLNDDEDVDIDFGHWFEPKHDPNIEPWSGLIPVTLRIEKRKEERREVPVLTYEA